MIKREDLVNTYIVNDKGVLRDTYSGVCKKHGISLDYISMWPNAKTYGIADHLPTNEVWADFGKKSIDKCKQLHLSDLIDLENSKVYTTDPEVIRKYAELCGKEVAHIGTYNGFYNGIGNNKIKGFTLGSHRNQDPNYHDVTELQINALYAEKFGDAGTETPEEKEVLDAIEPVKSCIHCKRGGKWEFTSGKPIDNGDTVALFDCVNSEKPLPGDFFDVVEWKNGDECIYMNHNVIQKFVGLDPDRNEHCWILSSKGQINIVEVNKLSKPETEAEREKRERVEYAKRMFLDAGYSDVLWHENPDDAHTVKIEEAISSMYELYDAGYRKQ